MARFRQWLRRHVRVFTSENLLALFICLVAILLLIAATDSAPRWIYQGF